MNGEVRPLTRDWLAPTGPVVYTLFNANDRVIYIGSSTSFHQRVASHQSGSWWWSQVARGELRRYPSMAHAVDAETSLILEHLPLWNTRGIPALIQEERRGAGMHPEQQRIARLRRLHPERFLRAA